MSVMRLIRIHNITFESNLGFFIPVGIKVIQKNQNNYELDFITFQKYVTPTQ